METRLQMIRSGMQEQELDGMLITNGYNRRYVSGFTGSSGCCLLTMEAADLITDFRYVEQATKQAPFFEIVRHQADMLDMAVNRAKHHGVRRLGFEKHHLTYALFQRLEEWAGDIELVPVAGIVEEARLMKTPEEVQIIKEAAEIADKAFSHILTYIRPGMKELEVANELEFYMRSLGASGSSFDIIVASGIRSALPHGVASDKVIEDGDMVTLDFGAYYKGYCSDITRTIAVGEPGKKMREIYDIVLRAQLNGVQNIRPGMTGKEADALTRDIIAAAGYGSMFGHSTGHGLGLEVHEGPTLSARGDRPLAPGMVVTIEPGIYLEGMGGVRIEDDVLITGDGCEILTKSPKELLVIQ
ncbi:Xaa-Pro peptidase family protein [Aneurinibacillus thermoaerophilus]|uniref:Xaa-Pro aminopeptidase n=1 Tax=Aneurinibacillus thermoaerophilus TaxID=143495 RepID=A0A1G8E744_ANETH|nr:MULTISPECIES: Xaa-Pro peptidase family protein [Aneurinibacillus]AMA72502.1 Xaa-Pro dipeptidase [Aneurinibacillus sp. XH2]MED0756604.1 Xaa-Pro peptidase family protein [Aneurinibacillus thermoaerophilus]MED0760654.1 Xaa-Pro peptidase family protein [Aneurinibacillus thermoaerophilus]SDH65713.1 Xaa-Pro aminopeptidase [Aneurinibacillus thermoaerophilus]